MNKIIVFVCIVMLPFSSAVAEGYQVNSQSAKQGGMGHAGAALKLGAESMHFNPAGMGFMNNTIALSGGFSAVFARAECVHESGKYKTDNGASTPLYFYGAFKIYDFLSAGISVTNPYGSTMDWGTNWAGSSLVQDISLKSFSVQPTVAFKIGDRLSLGAGMMILFGNFSLSRALIAAGGLESLRALSAVNPEMAAAITPTLDKFKDIPAASATLKGDADVNVGYNIGAMFDITDRITVGVSYRSKVMMKVGEGNATMDYANEDELNQLAATVNPTLVAMERKPIVVPPLDKGTFKAELPLPSNFTVGVSCKALDRLMLTGEVQFVGWGTYKELNVLFSQEVLGGYSIDAVKNYKNSRIYRLGGEYAATGRLDLRLGLYYDETPVREDHLNPETPGMNKLGTTVGFSFRPLEKLSVDFSFAYITGFGRDGSYTDTLNGSTFSGHYKATALNPTIGLSYAF